MKRFVLLFAMLLSINFIYSQKYITDFTNILVQTNHEMNLKRGDSVIYPPAYYVSSNQFVTFPISSGDLTKGFICGPNYFGDLAKAQKFTLDYAGSFLIKGIGFWIGTETSGTTGTLVFNIYKMTSTGPSTVLASKSIDFSTITKTGFVFYALANPVKVTTDFAIGANFSQMGSTMFSFVSTQNGSGGNKGRAWELQSTNKWYQMNDKINSFGLDADLMFAAVIDGSSFVDIPTSTFTMKTTECINKEVTVTYTGDAPSTASYNWDFGDAILVDGEGQGPMTFKWATEGNKSISLIVINDGATSAKTTKTINITTCDGINDLKALNSDVKLFPNPCMGILSIDIINKENKKIDMELRNMEGQIVYSYEIPNVSHFSDKLDLSGLSKGVYFAYFKTDTSYRVEKLIIQ